MIWEVSLDDAPWSGKPAEIDSDQIETLIEKNQHYTMWEIADMLKNMQINKVIGEKENCVLFYGKSHRDFLADLTYRQTLLY